MNKIAERKDLQELLTLVEDFKLMTNSESILLKNIIHKDTKKRLIHSYKQKNLGIKRIIK